MKTLNTVPYAALAAGAGLVFIAACSDAPFQSGSGSATSRVQFNLAGARTEAGAIVCAEATQATLLTSPDGRARAPVDRPLGLTECGADFEVTVPKGPVTFEGSLFGNGRLMFIGDSSIVAEKDGFVVVLDLTEINALDVEIETLPEGPDSRHNARYELEVAGLEQRIPVPADTALSLGALAAGGRMITLHGACGIVDGEPRVREVPIPVPSETTGHTRYEVDCSDGDSGSLTVIVTTLGVGSPPSNYVLTVTNPPSPAQPVQTITEQTLPQDEKVLTGVNPGPQEISMSTGICTVTDIDPREPFLLPAGSVTVNVTVLCELNVVDKGSLKIVTKVSNPPLPPGREHSFYEARVWDASGLVRKISLVGGDSATVTGLLVAENPYAVKLAPTDTCPVVSADSLHTNVQKNTLGRVEFTVGC